MKDTKNNWEKIDKIEKLRGEIEKLEKEKERFDGEELKEYFKDD